MSESVIEIIELTRRFGTKTALASVSLSLARGAVYGLVGLNGAEDDADQAHSEPAQGRERHGACLR